MEQIQEFLTQNIEVSAMAITFIIFEVYKRLTEKGHKFIPLFAGITGVIILALTNGQLNFDIVVRGAISGLAATGSFEIFKNLVREK